MKVQQRLEHKLETGIPGLAHLEVINESHRHNVPAGSESHFKVVLVSDDFDGMSLLARHRCINGLLADEFRDRVIHALTIHAYTGEEWRARMGNTPMSPPCMGGGRKGQPTN